MTEPTPDLSTITDRELEVLAAWCTAEGVKGAAYELGITVSGVRWHLERIREKLGVQTTQAAVYIARDRLP